MLKGQHISASLTLTGQRVLKLHCYNNMKTLIFSTQREVHMEKEFILGHPVKGCPSSILQGSSQDMFS